MYSGKSQKFNYYLRETSSNLYGYKGMILRETDVTITGGTKENVDTNKREIKVSIANEKVEVTIKNTPYLGEFEITKVDKNDNQIVLPNVEFKIKVDNNKYVQLKNKNSRVARVSGKVKGENGKVNYSSSSISSKFLWVFSMARGLPTCASSISVFPFHFSASICLSPQLLT